MHNSDIKSIAMPGIISKVTLSNNIQKLNKLPSHKAICTKSSQNTSNKTLKINSGDALKLKPNKNGLNLGSLFVESAEKSTFEEIMMPPAAVLTNKIIKRQNSEIFHDSNFNCIFQPQKHSLIRQKSVPILHSKRFVD